MKVIFHYWFCECLPLSTSADRLAVIAQAHRATWYRHSDEIKRVLDDILPGLERDYNNRTKAIIRLSKMGQKANSVKRAKVLQEKGIVLTEAAHFSTFPKKTGATRAERFARLEPVIGEPRSKGFRE